jgi:undecaprenyl-diphosphatase
VTLTYLDAIILGIVEGLTEFLPVSSTGHLTITEKLLGLPVDAKVVTAYTAIIQLGAIAATFLFFARKIARLFMAWARGLAGEEGRRNPDYTLAWSVIVGSLPVGVVGFLLRDVIEGPLRSLWVVAAALLLWSGVMWFAEQRHVQLERAGVHRDEHDLSVKDGLVIGLVQCLSLIPGVSRSGATISAGLLRGIDRVTATELSFFMAIPALTAAGVFQAVEQRHDLAQLGFGQMAVGIVVAFAVAYASIAWLLKYVAQHTFTGFVVYRVIVGLLLLGLLGTGVIAA